MNDDFWTDIFGDLPELEPLEIEQKGRHRSVCAGCNKIVMLSSAPDSDKPYYCESCRKKYQNIKQQKTNHKGSERSIMDNTIILTDSDGVNTEFEFLDFIATAGKEYVILLEVAPTNDGEVSIFRVEGTGTDESYVGVETVDEAEKVFRMFVQKNYDKYLFPEEFLKTLDASEETKAEEYHGRHLAPID